MLKGIPSKEAGWPEKVETVSTFSGQPASSLGIPFKLFLCFQVNLPLHLGFPLKGIPSEEAVCPEDMELFRFAGLLW